MELKPVSDTWERGDPYERYIGRWSRQVAPHFLAWLNLPPGQSWLDIGCGTGALSAAILDHGSPGWVAGLEPSAGFLRAAQANLAGRVRLLQATATALPLAGPAVAVVVSGLVLNFVPDPPAALLEMARVAGPGGVIGAYVWDYAGKMEFLRIFWDMAIGLDPGAARLDEGVRFPLCRPQALRQLFAGAGLDGVEVAAIDIPTLFADFVAYWQPFLGGQGPAPAYVMSLAPEARDRLRERLLARLDLEGTGPISLIARAWAVRGTVVK
jgi:SAM-dependent methyltransferase